MSLLEEEDRTFFDPSKYRLCIRHGAHRRDVTYPAQHSKGAIA